MLGKNNDYNFKIHNSLNRTKEVNFELENFLKDKNLEGVISILKDPCNARSFITRRGQRNKYIENLLSGFSFVFGIENWKDLEFNANSLDTVHRENIPEELLVEIMAAAYRFRHKKLFFDIYHTVINNENKIRDSKIVAGIYHEKASWLAEINNDWDGAIEANKKAINLTKKFEMNLLRNKILFGLSLNKGRRQIAQIKPKERITDFARFADIFRDMNDDHDAVRADLEKIKAMIELAVRKERKEKMEILEEALSFAKKAQVETKKMEYPNALIISKELLENIYSELGFENMALKYKKEVISLRDFYDYVFSKKSV